MERCKPRTSELWSPSLSFCDPWPVVYFGVLTRQRHPGCKDSFAWDSSERMSTGRVKEMWTSSPLFCSQSSNLTQPIRPWPFCARPPSAIRRPIASMGWRRSWRKQCSYWPWRPVAYTTRRRRFAENGMVGGSGGNELDSKDYIDVRSSTYEINGLFWSGPGIFETSFSQICWVKPIPLTWSRARTYESKRFSKAEPRFSRYSARLRRICWLPCC